jgi:hypothetical protein
MKYKLTPAQKIECLERAAQRLMDKENDYICCALQDVLWDLYNIDAPLSYVFICIPELLHYKPKYFDRNKNKTKSVIKPAGAWFHTDSLGKIERLRIIDMTIARIKSRSK